MNIRIKNKGFTLIELLVVIAIIGILASVVLASLNTARTKGANAAIKSTVNNARAQAELYYDDNGSVYTGVCGSPSPTGIKQFLDTADATNGVANSASCNDSDTAWALEAQLISTTAGVNSFYCVDSIGKATTGNASKNAVVQNATVCP